MRERQPRIAFALARANPPARIASSRAWGEASARSGIVGNRSVRVAKARPRVASVGFWGTVGGGGAAPGAAARTPGRADPTRREGAPRESFAAPGTRSPPAVPLDADRQAKPRLAQADRRLKLPILDQSLCPQPPDRILQLVPFQPRLFIQAGKPRRRTGPGLAVKGQAAEEQPLLGGGKRPIEHGFSRGGESGGVG